MIKKNVNLRQYNTFGINVFADSFFELNQLEEINYLKEILKNYDKKIILGGGSNLLFCNNFNGLVIKNNLSGIEIINRNEGKVIVSAAAGESWDNLVTFCVENNFYGIENLTAIPGTVGAAPVQNIGAYGVELKDVFYSLEGFSFSKNSFLTFNISTTEFGYRTSVFKKLKNDFLITKVNLQLSRNKKFNLEYKSLKDALSQYNIYEIDLKLINKIIREIRNSKLPDYTSLGNAGSFFKNPEIDEITFNKLFRDYPDISFFKVENKYKISAGWLIEKCGFKGKKDGNVGCYEKQALVIVNYGNATGNEILNFSNKIKNAVYEKFNINLEPEVNIIQ
ncbi:MAG: UDP-N-acetylmuramate dehydrogenase [Melioribacteraceae bacterium]|nr:UDP-N-acetylmuramate dehydrogenase [Melioribacteraceae bacterium]